MAREESALGRPRRLDGNFKKAMKVRYEVNVGEIERYRNSQSVLRRAVGMRRRATDKVWRKETVRNGTKIFGS